VLEACRVWNNFYPHETLREKVIKAGIKNVVTNTNMIGRWMVIKQNPLVIADAAHNIDGIKNIIHELKSIKAPVKHFVLGFVSDKDAGKILSLFPKDGQYYWCSPDIPRGKPAEETGMDGKKVGLNGEAYKSVGAAYRKAVSNAGQKDLVFVGGSSYVVGDFLAAIKK
jgi:dihydrofolate synthase / folylpolyglutamate synthase